MPEKPASADGYPPDQVARVKSTCLYLATKLGDLMPELVVVGGLVPSLLIDQEQLPENVTPHVGTFDLDLGLAFALVGEHRYQAVAERLRAAGFEMDKNEEGQPTRQRWRISDPPIARAQFQSRGGRRGGMRRQTGLGHGLRGHRRRLQADLGKAGPPPFERDTGPEKSDERKHREMDMAPIKAEAALAGGNRRGRNLHGPLHLSGAGGKVRKLSGGIAPIGQKLEVRPFPIVDSQRTGSGVENNRKHFAGSLRPVLIPFVNPANAGPRPTEIAAVGGCRRFIRIPEDPANIVRRHADEQRQRRAPALLERMPRRIQGRLRFITINMPRLAT